MATITLFSASGAPGVTTTAVALALKWPKPVILLEADPSGTAAIQAGYLRGDAPDERSVADLAIALRENELADSLPGVQVELGGNAQLIPGPRTHAQAVRTLPDLWEPLARVLRDQGEHGTDVIVDAGRLGTAGQPTPLINSSDLALLVMRTTLPSIAGCREWAATLKAQFAELGAPDSIGLLIIGAGHPYSAREIRAALELPVMVRLPADPVAAEVYHLGATPGRRHDRAPLVKALPAAVEAIQTHVHRQKAALQETHRD